MDRTSIIAGLEEVAESPSPVGIPRNCWPHPIAREAADMLRGDAEEIEILRRGSRLRAQLEEPPRPHDLEELDRLRVLEIGLRASDEKKAERIEKLVKAASGMLGLIDHAAGHSVVIGQNFWRNSPLRRDTIEALPDETEQPFGPHPHDGGRHDLSHDQPYAHTARDAVKKLADSVQQCATDINTRNPSIYNAALTWQRLEELRAWAIRGCLLAGPGRGDCMNFVGLPEDENRETTDEYGRPHGWCQVCWLAERERRMCNKVRELSEAAVEFVRLDSMPHTLPNAGNARIARDKLFELAGGEGAT